MYKVHLFQYKSQFNNVLNVNPGNQGPPIIFSRISVYWQAIYNSSLLFWATCKLIILYIIAYAQYDRNSRLRKRANDLHTTELPHDCLSQYRNSENARCLWFQIYETLFILHLYKYYIRLTEFTSHLIEITVWWLWEGSWNALRILLSYAFPQLSCCAHSGALFHAYR
jgi:hypothetical protein